MSKGYYKAELGDVFRYKGQLVEVKWINPGKKTIGFTTKETAVCPHCKGLLNESHDLIEESPSFQEAVIPISTLKKYD